MNAQTEKLTLQGLAGTIQALRDAPAGISRGVAVIAHPHPLFQGTMDNKVVQTLARAYVQCGWTAVRFNFRGVGSSAGEYDHGNGETQDLLQVIEQVASQGQPLAMAGFSFGSFVTARALEALAPVRQPHNVVLVGPATSRFELPPVPADLHARTLVVHGETDDVVPLSATMDWARPQSMPVTVVPGVGHFFHGQLPLLKQLVVRHISSVGA